MTTTGPTGDQPAAVRLGLRRVTVEDVVDTVEKALHTRLDSTAAVIKRRSMGFPSDRGTWVRIECRGLERLDGQGWGWKPPPSGPTCRFRSGTPACPGTTWIRGLCGAPTRPN